MSLQAGQVIEGKYRIVRIIGEGGMGAVFEGENIRIQRRVAIKVLHPAFSGNTDVTQRFEREAQAAGKIGNDHILEVLDMGTLPDGSHFMVLEFLDGEPLSTRIRRLGRLTPKQLAPLALQVAQGLGAAHAAGIIHRDLKPDNIFVLKEKAGHRDYVKIIDFGISKFQALSGDGMKMTNTGAVMGTPYYMSPEQASGSRPADGRSDLYSVGVILYECVTGRVPFDGETFNQLMFKIVLSEPPPLAEVVPDLDPAFASIIIKAMARDAAHRFQSAEELANAITAWVERGAMVSDPPPAAPDAVVPGLSRDRLASVSGLLPNETASGVGARKGGATPAATPNPMAASRPALHQQTHGTFATSQAGVTPSKSTITAAVAGGVLLLGGIVVAVALHKSSTPTAEGAAGSAAPVSAPVAAAATQAAPVAPVNTAPAVAVAPVAPATPATAEPAAPAPSPSSATPAAAPKSAARPVAKPAPAPAKPAPAAAAGHRHTDFGY